MPTGGERPPQTPCGTPGRGCWLSRDPPCNPPQVLINKGWLKSWAQGNVPRALQYVLVGRGGGLLSPHSQSPPFPLKFRPCRFPSDHWMGDNSRALNQRDSRGISAAPADGLLAEPQSRKELHRGAALLPHPLLFLLRGYTFLLGLCQDRTE